jgi:hypothetical protein
MRMMIALDITASTALVEALMSNAIAAAVAAKAKAALSPQKSILTKKTKSCFVLFF